MIISTLLIEATKKPAPRRVVTAADFSLYSWFAPKPKRRRPPYLRFIRRRVRALTKFFKCRWAA